MGITHKERALINKLGECFGDFVLMDELHPNDSREFAAAIHVCQNIVMSRPGFREIWPNGFRGGG